MASDGSVSLRAKLDTSDVQKGTSRIKASLQGISDTDKKFNWSGLKAGSTAASALSKAASVAKKGIGAIGQAAITIGKVGVGAIGGITTAVGGLALTGGIARAMAIGEAQAKMNQLGMDTEKVMDSVKASVSGTKFALNEAASSAVSLGSAGVAAGEDMTQALQSVASTASISGAEFSEIGAIYSKVAASGKLSGEVMAQLLERGVSVTAALSKKLGKTQEEVKEMVKEGEIDFKTFSEAMQEYLGDAADSANSTFSGAMANVRAALSRVGAAFADPALEALRKIFVALIPTIDKCAKALQPMADAFGAFCEQVADAVIPQIESIVEWFKTLMDTVVLFFGDVISQIDFEGFARAFGTVAEAFASIFSPDQTEAALSFSSIVADVINGLIPIIETLTPVVQTLVTCISDFFEGVLSTIDFEGFSNAFQTLGDAFTSIFSEENGNNATTFGQSVGDAINILIPIIETLAAILPIVASVIGWIVDNLNWLLPLVIGIAGAMALLNIVSTVAGFFGSFGTAAANAGSAAGRSAPQLLALAVAAIGIGAGIAIACAGLYLLVQAAVQLTGAGPGATAVFFGMIVALGALVVLFAVFGPALDAAALGMIAFGGAVLLAGAGLMLAGVGAKLVSDALPGFVEYGGEAALKMLALSGALSTLLIPLGAVALEAGGAALAIGGLDFAMGPLAIEASTCGNGFKQMADAIKSMKTTLPSFTRSVEAATKQLPGFKSVAEAAAPSVSKLASTMTSLTTTGSITTTLFASLSSLLVRAAQGAQSLTISFQTLAPTIPAVTQTVIYLTGVMPAFAKEVSNCASFMRTLAATSSVLASAVMATAQPFTQVAGCVVIITGVAETCNARLLLLISTLGQGGTALSSYTAALNTTSEALDNTSAKASRCATSFMASTVSMTTATQIMRASILSELTAITSAFANMRLHIPSPSLGKLPHFSLTGAFDLLTGKVPKIKVDWYAKGGVFDSASIIGVGEAGSEAVVPLSGARMRPFAQAIAGEMQGARTSTDQSVRIEINIENVNNYTPEDTEQLTERIARDIQRKLSYSKRAKGVI